MTTLLFAYTDSDGYYQEAYYGDKNLEACLDALSELVQQGFFFHKVYLIQHKQRIELPTEAFDGKLMGYLVKSLQDQWEMILC